MSSRDSRADRSSKLQPRNEDRWGDHWKMSEAIEELKIVVLPEFADSPLHPKLQKNPDGKGFAPYALSGFQVGGIRGLLWAASQLLKEKKQLLEENDRFRERLGEAESLSDTFVRQAIAHLDPDRH